VRGDYPERNDGGMNAQHLSVNAVDIGELALTPIGPWPPGSQDTPGGPQAYDYPVSDDGHVQTGVWSCTPGTFDVRCEGESEFMHFVAGRARIIDADGTVHDVRPGVAIFVPDGWVGRWEIEETVRKTYVIVATRPAVAATEGEPAAN
jgi:uncharacterized cupin superfamily protein